MKKVNIILFSLLALGQMGLAQGIRLDGAVALRTDGAASIVTSGNFQVNAGGILTLASTSTIRLDGAAQTVDFGGATLGTFLVEGTGNKTVQQNLTCVNLTVSTGATLVVPANVTTTVTTALNYAGNITVQSGGSLVQTVGSTLGTTSGTFTALRAVASKVGFGYNFISPPTSGTVLNSIGTASYPNNRFRHDPTLAPGARWIAVAGASVLANGTGYTFLSPSGASTLTFVGPPGNGPINVPLTGQAAYRFNLVGNPYPSPIQLASLFTDNSSGTGITGTAWFWQDNNNNTGTGSYLPLNAVTNPTARVAVGQGFMVQGQANAGTLAFNNGQRVADNPTFYRPEGDMERFRLGVASASGTDEVWVAFAPQFTTGFENGYDAEKLDGATHVSLATVVNDQRLSVAALPQQLNGRFELPVSLMASRAGAYTFAAKETDTPTTKKLFLEDRQTGEYYYLQPGRNHTLNLQAGNYRDRFYLLGSGEVVGQPQTGEMAAAYSFGRDLFVEADQTAEVRLYTVMGVEVARFAGVRGGALRRLPVDVPASGIYVVRVTSASGTVEKQVWLER